MKESTQKDYPSIEDLKRALKKSKIAKYLLISDTPENFPVNSDDVERLIVIQSKKTKKIYAFRTSEWGLRNNWCYFWGSGHLRVAFHDRMGNSEIDPSILPEDSNLDGWKISKTN